MDWEDGETIGENSNIGENTGRGMIRYIVKFVQRSSMR
jgi:hypothetical protein